MATEITPSSGEARELSTSDAVHTLIANFLGWMLDAFDFFILVFATDSREGLPSLSRRYRISIWTEKSGIGPGAIKAANDHPLLWKRHSNMK